MSALLVPLLLSAACATSREEPVIPEGVVVTPLEKGRLFGGQAQYVVEAPLPVVREVVLDFESHEEFRPLVLEARSLTRGEAGGRVFFKFEGAAGYDPGATCRYTIEEEGDRVVVRYEMIDPGMALWALEGGFDLRAVGERTLVLQDFLVSALVMDRDRFLSSLERDAAALRERAEAVAAGRTPKDGAGGGDR